MSTHLHWDEIQETHGLLKVWALSRHLEEEVLLGQPVLVAASREAQSLVDIILVDHVFDNGPRFPERNARVGVFERRDAAIGVDLDKLGGLGVLETDLNNFVVQVQFIEDHADLGRVGTVAAVELERLKRHGVRDLEFD